jgi:uncharacterized protein
MFTQRSIAPLEVDVAVWVQPGSSRSRVAGTHGDPPRIKIQVAAPAVEGAANEELERFLSKLLKARLEIVRGAHSRAKTVRIYGLAIEDIRTKLGVQ